jgi:serine/threonine protein kinase
MGTLNYMAPEQGLKGESDNRSDIYSLGIVFYEMLTGYTPFDADTPLAILMKHLNDPLPIPTQIDPTLPPALEMIVLKALAKDPDDRYQTADEMSESLRQATDNLPTDKRPTVLPPGGFPQQAVFSGTSRKQIIDHRFADADTDMEVKPIGNTSSNFESDFSTSTILPTLTDTISKLRIVNIGPVAGVFGGFALYLFVNFVIAMLSTISGRNIISRAWPVEIFLFASFLALIGWGTQVWGTMVPSGIAFGNAFILAYCAVTGRWGDWAFLWMLELLIIFASVFIPVQIGQAPKTARIWARVFGLTMTTLALFFSAINIFFAFILAS